MIATDDDEEEEGMSLLSALAPGSKELIAALREAVPDHVQEACDQRAGVRAAEVGVDHLSPRSEHRGGCTQIAAPELPREVPGVGVLPAVIDARAGDGRLGTFAEQPPAPD